MPPQAVSPAQTIAKPKTSIARLAGQPSVDAREVPEGERKMVTGLFADIQGGGRYRQVAIVL
jgi:hypothetical protein